MNISEHAQKIADLTEISRADLHTALLMFLENVYCGYEKHRCMDTSEEVDYAALKEDFNSMDRKEISIQVKQMFRAFDASHSKLLAAHADGNQNEFEQIIEDTINEVFYSTGFDNQQGNTSSISSGVCRVGISLYTSLNEAIKASNGSTISLLSDITENVVVPEDVSAVINLNKKKITNFDDHTIHNYGGLTIKGDGVVDNITHARAAIFNDIGASCIIEGGNFNRSKENGIDKENSGGNSYYTVLNHGDMIINAGKFTQGKDQEGRYSSLFDNGWYDGTKNQSKSLSTLIINGGEFVGGLNSIKNDDWGKIEIHGGSFKNSAQNTIMNHNFLDISDGDFTGDKVVLFNKKYDDLMDNGKCTISGGSFTGKFQIESGDVSLTGGIYSADISSYVVEGYKAKAVTAGFHVVKDNAAIIDNSSDEESDEVLPPEESSIPVEELNITTEAEEPIEDTTHVDENDMEENVNWEEVLSSK